MRLSTRAGVLAGSCSLVPAHLPRRFQVSQTVQERLYVGAVKGGGHLAVITAGRVQMRRQPGDGGNDALDPGVGPFAPVHGVSRQQPSALPPAGATAGGYR